MGAKYRMDSYLLIGFDGHGAKLFTEIASENLTDSQALGRVRMESGDCASFAILRVLHNSIDAAKGDRWMPRGNTP